MDAEYLKKNVNVALMESLASMAIAKPDDCVDYIGKYLLQYVERGALKVKEKDILEAVIGNSEVFEKSESQKAKLALEERLKQEEYEGKVAAFLDSLAALCTSKQDCMDRCTNFLADYLDVPASYVATKRVVNEVETLYYVSANVSQKKVILGRKLVKAVEDGDEPPVRQGFSFDAFKTPEVPEEEPLGGGDDDDDASQAAPPQAPTGPIPFIIENVMRDKRTKFFGIPKLGAFLAIPFSIESIDHEAGCQSASGDLHRGPFSKNIITTPMLLCMDTVGKFRSFTPREIDIVKQVADRMSQVILVMENQMFTEHEKYLNKQVHEIKSIIDLSVKLRELEDTAVAELEQEPEGDFAELMRTFHDAEARLWEYSKAISTPPFQPVLGGMDEHVLPLPQTVGNLLYTIGVLTGMNPALFKEPSGDVSWEMSKKLLYQVMLGVGKFSPKGEYRVSREASVAAVRAYSEANGLTDPAVFPSYLPVLQVLHSWLFKALAARELGIAMMRETEKIEIEIIV